MVRTHFSEFKRGCRRLRLSSLARSRPSGRLLAGDAARVRPILGQQPSVWTAATGRRGVCFRHPLLAAVRLDGCARAMRRACPQSLARSRPSGRLRRAGEHQFPAKLSLTWVPHPALFYGRDWVHACGGAASHHFSIQHLLSFGFILEFSSTRNAQW